MGELHKIIIPESYGRLNEASRPYFRRTREAFVGKKLEEFSPIGPERDRHWRGIKDGVDVVDGWLAKDSEEGQAYIFGDAPGYADIILASRLMWMKVVFGEDSELWKDVCSWNGGRWERILKSMEKYESVV
jgi:glutathione S-transferase